jgi:hypothetical protein
MINYALLKKQLNELKDDLFTANLPDESQVVVNADKAIDHLQLKLEVEKQLVLTLSKICGTLIVDVEQAIRSDLEVSKKLRDEAYSLQERSDGIRSRVVSLVDTREKTDE